MRRDIRPAQGERNAVRGFSAQYRAAAEIILAALANDTLEFIKVGDPDAGRVDDIQVATVSRLDAYQVKWAESPGLFSFNDLVQPRSGNPSLIAQLADGWTRLEAENPSRNVVVHLYTNNLPSPNAKLPIGDPVPTPPTFAAFVSQVWLPAREALRQGDYSPPAPWLPAWEALRSASGLTPEQFGDFLLHCDLDFGRAFPSDRASRAEIQHAEDVDALRQYLADRAGDASRTVTIRRARIVTELRWASRYAVRNVHEFPVDEARYQPITTTIQALDQRIADTTGGYIAVVGPPGSGKSTLLSRVLIERPERIIPYYAYVPDDTYGTPLRGEAENYLHDMAFGLARAGVGTGPNRPDRASLLSHFQGQLRLLHQEYRETGRKTILLIDGIDHIGREQHPVRALFLDLPSPEQVPDGVILLLGTQTVDPLPSAIQAALQGGRAIEMDRLRREDVVAVVEKSALPVGLRQKDVERIFSLSGGHPLALSYLLDALAEVTDEAGVETILDETQPFTGRIENLYECHWQAIREDEGFVELLGILVRMRGAIDLTWMGTWADRATLGRLQRLRHYFRRETETRWYIHHNSFRLFLMDRTAQFPTGGFNEAWDRGYHGKLADLCAASPEGTYQQWEEIYHRVRAGQHARVVELSTAQRFREQLLAFRPAEAVRRDLRTSMEAAAETEDAIAIVRLILGDAEFVQRERYLDAATFAKLFLSLDLPAAALERLRDGNRLLVKPSDAMEACGTLKDMGLKSEARHLFELAEPLAELKGAGDRSAGWQEEELLSTWASAAVDFHPIERIISIINQVQRPAHDYHDVNAEEATGRMRRWMLLSAAYVLAEELRWEDFGKVEVALREAWPSHAHARFRLFLDAALHCYHARDIERAMHFVATASGLEEAWWDDPTERWRLAEATYFILEDPDRARVMLEGVEQPQLNENRLRSEEKFQPFRPRYSYNRLLYLLGSTHTPSEAIPHPSRPETEGLMYFERAVITVARLDAFARTERQLEPPAFLMDAAPVLRLFHQTHAETHDWHWWHLAQTGRDELYEHLINAAGRHGKSVLKALRAEFERLWSSGDTRAFWPVDVRRHVILALWQEGEPYAWAAGALAALENEIDAGSISDRVDENRRQAEAWMRLGETEQARRAATKALQASFGVAIEDDYQFDAWVRWLGYVVALDPDEASARISTMAHAIRRLESIDASGVTDAAEALLEVAFAWRPAGAALLFEWFMDHGVLAYEAGWRALLRASLHSASPPVKVVKHSLTQLLFPITLAVDKELVSRLIRNTCRTAGQDGASRLARDVVRYCDLYLLPSNRADWKSAIAQAMHAEGVGVESAGLTDQDLAPPTDHTSPPSPLRLQDGTEIPAEEVHRQAGSPSALVSLVAAESEEWRFFHWDEHVERLLPAMGVEDVRQVAVAFRGRHRTKVLCWLASRLLELGDRPGAKELAEEAIAEGSGSGWWPRYDGGTRILAFEVLNRIDRESRKEAFRQLARDARTETWPSLYIAQSFDRVLPLLVDTVPFAQVWQEIEVYLSEMVCNVGLATEPDFIGAATPDWDGAVAVADLLVRQLGHRIVVVDHGAQRAVMDLLISHDSATTSAIARHLDGPEVLQQGILPVLDAASQVDPDSCGPFSLGLAGLTRSPSLALGAAAASICARLGVPAEAPAPRSLPAVYSLHLPRDDREASHWRGIEEEPITEIAAPVDLLSPYDDNVRWLADATGIPKESLYQRAITLMRELEPEDTWNTAGHQRMLSYYGGMRLRYTYRRPRVQVGRRAVWHVAAELREAGRLRGQALEAAEIIMRYYDPAALTTRPAHRPSAVPPFTDLERMHGNLEQWVESLDNAFDYLCLTTADGRIVVGEVTEIRDLNWRAPTETREAGAYFSGSPVLPVNNDPFSHVPRWTLMSEYSTLRSTGFPRHLVVECFAAGFDTPGTRWIALNPILAQDMKWRLSGDGWFRWVDDGGRTMAESIWWQDGYVGHEPPHLHDQCGKGWLVVVDPDGLAAVAAKHGTLARRCRVHREFGAGASRTSSRTDRLF